MRTPRGYALYVARAAADRMMDSSQEDFAALFLAFDAISRGVSRELARVSDFRLMSSIVEAVDGTVWLKTAIIPLAPDAPMARLRDALGLDFHDRMPSRLSVGVWPLHVEPSGREETFRFEVHLGGRWYGIEQCDLENMVSTARQQLRRSLGSLRAAVLWTGEIVVRAKGEGDIRQVDPALPSFLLISRREQDPLFPALTEIAMNPALVENPEELLSWMDRHFDRDRPDNRGNITVLSSEELRECAGWLAGKKGMLPGRILDCLVYHYIHRQGFQSLIVSGGRLVGHKDGVMRFLQHRFSRERLETIVIRGVIVARGDIAAPAGTPFEGRWRVAIASTLYTLRLKGAKGERIEVSLEEASPFE